MLLFFTTYSYILHFSKSVCYNCAFVMPQRTVDHIQEAVKNIVISSVLNINFFWQNFLEAALRTKIMNQGFQSLTFSHPSPCSFTSMVQVSQPVCHPGQLSSFRQLPWRWQEQPPFRRGFYMMKCTADLCLSFFCAPWHLPRPLDLLWNSTSTQQDWFTGWVPCLFTISV